MQGMYERLCAARVLELARCIPVVTLLGARAMTRGADRYNGLSFRGRIPHGT